MQQDFINSGEAAAHTLLAEVVVIGVAAATARATISFAWILASRVANPELLLLLLLLPLQLLGRTFRLLADGGAEALPSARGRA